MCSEYCTNIAQTYVHTLYVERSKKESVEVMGGPGSILTVSLDFLFSRSKASDVDVGIIAILVHFE